MEDKKIVLLIDAENTSARYADCIMHYLEKQGIIISARIYGDFINNNNVKGWNLKAIQYEMEQKQQLTTSAGKNASDIALVIDAMDLLYQKKDINTFCIVTSDGDFTNLVKRIREDSKTVIGIGKADASKRLGKVCDVYLDFDQIEERLEKESGQKTESRAVKNKKAEQKKNESAKTDKKTTAKKNEMPKTDTKKAVKKNETSGADKKTANEENGQNKKVEPIKNIKMALNELVQQDENAGRYADLGGIKSRLQLRYPGFNEKDYGYKTIWELIDQETKFEVYQDGKHTYVRAGKKTAEKETAEDTLLEDVCRFLLEQFSDKVVGLHELAAFGKKLHAAFPDFNYKDYGYGKLSNFLEDLGFRIY
ncbi:MAG: NYN domain-containing protein [Lachnospiraceae bacterium]|nr:NYN domain-containing protein [Lachnospiraceae bacterium]